MPERSSLPVAPVAGPKASKPEAGVQGRRERTGLEGPAAGYLALQRAVGNRAALSAVRGRAGLQRRFLQKPGEGPPVPVGPDEVWEALGKAGKLGALGPAGPEKQKELLRKLGEGADIVYAAPEDLADAVRERLRALPGLVTPKSRDRKLNRIVGQLEAKLALLRAQQAKATGPEQLPAEILDGLEAVRRMAPDMALAPKTVDVCRRVLAQFRDCVSTVGPRGMWLAYSALSNFGPLGHLLVQGNDRLSSIQTDNLAVLRDIRQAMAARDTASVVAHRGAGPTNRTMGGLVQETDQRRTRRPAENSPEAFEAALAETTRPSLTEAPPVPALDGVECDVFLSKDGVAMLSHEGKVLEQLNDARKQLARAQGVGEHTEVRHMGAEALVAMQRTGNPGSGFMTLAALIDMVVPVARTYHEATGHPLRLEVEMKGSKEDKHFRREEGGRPPLLAAVSKVLSRALKADPGLPVEFVLFNGTRSDVVTFSHIRQTKTALGGMYTAEGGKRGVWQKEGLPSPEHVDELRYQFTDEVGTGDLDDVLRAVESGSPELPGATALLERYIVTLVYGQEFAPTGHPEYATALRDVEPSEEVLFGEGRTSKVMKANSGRAYDDKIERLLVAYVKAGGRTDKLHILTDYPKKAAYLKALMAKVKPLEVELGKAESRDSSRGGHMSEPVPSPSSSGSPGSSRPWTSVVSSTPPSEPKLGAPSVGSPVRAMPGGSLVKPATKPVVKSPVLPALRHGEVRVTVVNVVTDKGIAFVETQGGQRLFVPGKFAAGLRAKQRVIVTYKPATEEGKLPVVTSLRLDG
jgi:glycerophosphoryl diester phosphodiesterase